MFLFKEPLPSIPITGWTAPKEFPRLEAAKILSLDTETYDPNLDTTGPGWATGDGHIVGISVGTDDGHNWYFPMRHEVGGGNMDPDAVLRWARAELTRPEQPKIGANLQYDIGWLKREGVNVAGDLYDVQFAEPLLDEHRFSYSLGALADTYLTDNKVDEALYDWCQRAYGGPAGRKQAGNIYRAPACLVGPYAESDADLPMRIYQQQGQLLNEQGLMDLFRMECSLIYMLVDMRMRGVCVDVAAAEQANERMKLREAEIEKALGGINVDAPADLQRAFDKEGVPYPKTAKGNPSFKKTFLEACNHPLAKMIMDKRKIAKSRGTFVEGYVLDKAHNGRVHGEFHPLRSDEGGTVSGRFSSCLPDHVEVTTPTGDKLLRDIQIGDEVWTHKCRWNRVLNKRFTGNHKTFKIYLDNGKSIECTSNHRLLTNMGWLSLEDIYERQHGKEIGPDHLSKCCEGISWRGQAYSKRDGASLWSGRADCALHTEPGHPERTIHHRESSEVCQEQDRRQEPDDRAVPRTAPQLQGCAERERWVPDNPTPGMVHREPDSEACCASSCSDVRGSGYHGDPCGISRTPHKQRHHEQSTIQSGVSVCCGAQGDTQTYSAIREVEYVGVLPVYDLEVEADHCFLVNGIFVHNSNPNLQNIPARDEEMKTLIRGLFLPEEGERWVSIDYSQIEYRFMVHAASGPGAEDARQQYRDNPKTDYHIMTQQMIKTLLGRDVARKPVKNINFGKIFGMGKATLMAQLAGLTRAEAEEFFTAYDAAVPYAKTTAERASAKAQSRGHIFTILKRRARFPYWEPAKYYNEQDKKKILQDDPTFFDLQPNREAAVNKWGNRVKRARTHKAMNCYTQGSGADLMKKAMQDIYYGGMPLSLLTVHDELNWSLPFGTDGDKMITDLVDVMEHAVKLKIPVLADVETGPNWGALK